MLPAMSVKLEIDVDVDVEGFLRDAGGLVDGELKPAMARIANRLGELVQDRLQMRRAGSSTARTA